MKIIPRQICYQSLTSILFNWEKAKRELGIADTATDRCLLKRIRFSQLPPSCYPRHQRRPPPREAFRPLFLSSSMMGFSGLISIVFLLDMYPAMLESLNACAFM
ncbi:unnamed protein product, partial [Vitis vinifera]